MLIHPHRFRVITVCRVSVRNEMLSTCSAYSESCHHLVPRVFSVFPMGHFPVTKTLTFKTRVSAKLSFVLWALPRIFRLFWISPQRIPSQLEPPKIIPESKISNLPTTFDHLGHLNSDFPSPPLSTPQGLSLALSQSIGATWQWSIGTRRPWGRGSAPMTSLILDSFKQTNKKPRNYFSRRINGHRK